MTCDSADRSSIHPQRCRHEVYSAVPPAFHRSAAQPIAPPSLKAAHSLPSTFSRAESEHCEGAGGLHGIEGCGAGHTRSSPERKTSQSALHSREVPPHNPARCGGSGSPPLRWRATKASGRVRVEAALLAPSLARRPAWCAFRGSGACQRIPLLTAARTYDPHASGWGIRAGPPRDHSDRLLFDRGPAPRPRGLSPVPGARPRTCRAGNGTGAATRGGNRHRGRAPLWA